MRPSGLAALTPLRVSSLGADTVRVDPQAFRYSERPELWEAYGELFDGVWPEYNKAQR